jgi:hypothetical protein
MASLKIPGVVAGSIGFDGLAFMVWADCHVDHGTQTIGSWDSNH